MDRRLDLHVACPCALKPDEEERRDRCRVIARCSQSRTSNVVVLDYVRESQERRERAANIAEAELRY